MPKFELIFDSLKSTTNVNYKYIIRASKGRYSAETKDMCYLFISITSILNIKAWGRNGYK